MKLALAADLHFGSVPDGLAEMLRETIESEAPDLIVIAGDLTLRARRREFEQASNWLNSLSIQALVLPGNHDLPYWNLFSRFFEPFQRYSQVPGASTLMPAVEKAGGFVLGFNTTRSWQPHLQWQEGVARRIDIAAASEALSLSPVPMFKAVAAHHPFVRVLENPRAKPVRRAKLALQAFAQSGVELIMSGHTHQSFATQIYVAERPVVFVGAPTALSWRQRGEANGFWILEAKEKAIECVLWLRDAASFAPRAMRTFERF